MVDEEKIFVDNSQSSKLYFYQKPIQNSQKTIERHSDIEEIEFYFLKQVFSISLIVSINFRFGFAAIDLWRLIFFPSWLYGYNLFNKSAPWVMTIGIYQLDFPRVK